MNHHIFKPPPPPLLSSIYHHKQTNHHTRPSPYNNNNNTNTVQQPSATLMSHHDNTDSFCLPTHHYHIDNDNVIITIDFNFIASYQPTWSSNSNDTNLITFFISSTFLCCAVEFTFRLCIFYVEFDSGMWWTFINFVHVKHIKKYFWLVRMLLFWSL